MRTPKPDPDAARKQKPMLAVPERAAGGAAPRTSPPKRKPKPTDATPSTAPRPSKQPSGRGGAAGAGAPKPPTAAVAPFDVRGGGDELDDTSSSDGHHAPLRRTVARHAASSSTDSTEPMMPGEAGSDGPRTVRKQPRHQLQTAAALSPTEKARRDRQERAFDVRKVKGTMADAPAGPVDAEDVNVEGGSDSGDDDDDEDEENAPVTWSTRLFKDVFIDWGVIAEVVLCHPCNISAQINAALADEPAPVAEAAASPSGPGVVREELASTRQDIRRRRNFSSSSSDEDDRRAGGAPEDARLAALREQLPPLDVVPCVGVIVLDFMCCGAGSMYFGYWIRNELAQRFHLVPDVGHLPTDDLAASFSGFSDSSRNSPPTRGGMDKVAVGRKVTRRKKNGGDGDGDGGDDNGSGSPGLFTKEGAKVRASVAKDKAKDAAARAARKSEKLARKAAKKAARTSAEYLQSTVYSAVCWPCALCQTHRELEVRGFRPVRYLSSTRTAVQYAAGSLTGQPGMVAGSMR